MSSRVLSWVEEIQSRTDAERAIDLLPADERDHVLRHIAVQHPRIVLDAVHDENAAHLPTIPPGRAVTMPPARPGAPAPTGDPT